MNQQNGYVGYCISESCLQSPIFISRYQMVWKRNVKYVKQMYTRISLSVKFGTQAPDQNPIIDIPRSCKSTIGSMVAGVCR